MGRAFRVVKRTAHLTVAVSEKPIKVGAESAAEAADGGKAKASKKKAAPATKADKE